MIRFADNNDTPAVKQLWNICFGEDMEFNKWFFENRYKPAENLLSLDSDGNLLAMAQMLPYAYSNGGKESEVTYIYGACTAPEHRKKGIMAQLLKRSFEIDKELGRTASVLIPAEPWLFDFYRKYGYEKAFYVNTKQLECRPDTLSEAAVRPAENTDIYEMNKIYRRFSGERRLEHTKNQWSEQIKMFRDLGGEAYVFQNEQGGICGYAFVWKGETILTAQEAMGDDIENYLNKIMLKNGRKSIEYTTSGNKKCLGCLCSHTKLTAKSGYFNLMFN